MFAISSGDELVSFVQNFTGSTNVQEIQNCIFMAELSMRNIELPALRCDPYAIENIGIVDSNGRIPIPGDMNKPILFFKQGRQFITTAQATGTQGQTYITCTTTPTQPLANGMFVTGNGIAPNTTINSITGSSTLPTVNLNYALTGNVNGTITFATSSNQSSQTGPWIVYDRIGDRDIIAQSMIAQLYLQPVNVPAVIRGKFSEVGQEYEFLPYVAEGDLINMYYYKAWPLLFSPVDDTLISTTGTVSGVSGDNGTLTITDTSQLAAGDQLYATSGVGSLNGIVTIVAIINGTQLTFTSTGTPTAGAVTNVYLTAQTVQSNAVLSTWPEGYVYSTLREYYIKRHNDQDAQVYATRFDEAWQQVEDQNNLGKWSGGHTRLTSVWQPRQYRQYNIK
jgi:hypothetical protein